MDNHDELKQEQIQAQSAPAARKTLLSEFRGTLKRFDRSNPANQNTYSDPAQSFERNAELILSSEQLTREVLSNIAVIAFVGASGTGKSTRAIKVARDNNIYYIIDDGLLINGSRIVAGTSAKKAPTKMESVRQAIELARENDLRLHICHLSSAKSLSLAKSASKSMPISWEFTPHHLLLDNSAYNTYGTYIKTNPPLRPKGESVKISDLDERSVIGTDHAPHTLEDKTKGTWESSPGIPNLETVVPLLLTEVNKGNIDLKLIPKIFSQNAAEIYGLNNKGKIEIGYDADLTVIDLKREGKFNIEEFKTKAEYSPFDGWKYKGLPVMTIVNGKTVMNKL